MVKESATFFLGTLKSASKQVSIQTFVFLVAIVFSFVMPDDSNCSQTTFNEQIENTSQTITITDQEKNWLKDHPHIIITTDLDTPPYIFRNTDNEPVGVLRDIADRIEDLFEIEISFDGTNYQGLIEAVLQGSADVTILNDPLDAPYQDRYLKTQDLMFLPYSLWGRKDSDLVTSPENVMSGKRITLNEGWNLAHPFLQQFKQCEIIAKPDVLDCMNAVLNGQADAYLEVYGIMRDFTERNMIRDLVPIKVYNEGCPAAFFVRKDWAEFHLLLNKFLASFSIEERISILRKWNAYLDDPIFRLITIELTTEEREWLNKHPVLKVGADEAWPPIEYRDEKGEYRGISPDYLELISDMLGVRLDYVSGSWAKLLQKSAAGEIDLFASMSLTPSRESRFLFTSPYTFFPIGCFTRGDIPFIGKMEELRGRKVGVVQGYAVEEWFKKDFPEIPLILFENIPSALKGLRSKDIDVFLENTLTGITFIRQLGFVELKIAGDTPYQYDNRMAVPHDRSILVGILEKAIQSIPQDHRDAIYNKWVSIKYDQGFDYSLVWKVALGTGLVVILLIGWNRWLAIVVKRKTKDLSDLNASLLSEIEERKTIEAKLREREETYHALFEQSPHPVVVTRLDGKYIDGNERFFESAGLKREEVIGRTAVDLGFVDSVTSKIIEKRLEESNGLLSNFETVLKRGDGQNRYCLLTSKLIEYQGNPAIITIIDDITDRYHAEEALRESEVRYRALFNAATDAIFLLDTLTFVECNDATLSLFGCSREEIIGMTVMDYSPERQPDGVSSQEKALKYVDAIKTEGNQFFVWKHRKKDGSLFDAEVSLSPLEIYGRLHLLAFVRDITERRLLEDQLRQAQKMEAVGQLAGGVAHDFNNLLLVINGYTDIAMQDTPKDSPLQQALMQVKQAGERAATLVRQLLTFSRRSAVRMERVQLDKLITGLLKMIRRIIGEQIELSYTPHPVNDWIQADPGQIEQILMNLCVNARDAMPNGGRLAIELETFHVDENYSVLHPEAKVGEYVVLSVSDSGTGIPQEIRNRIFEPFFTTKGVGQGTGLGLATVFAITQRHGGFINLYSEPGLGTSFKIFFPVSNPPSQPEVENLAEKEKSFEGCGEKILIAEDDDQVRNLAVLVLEKAGYQVVSASDGNDAMSKFDQHHADCDLVILDVVMPKRSGRQVHDYIRELRQDLPIIFASGYSFSILEAGHLPEGSYNLIHKPYDPRDLLCKIREELEKKRKNP